MIALFTDFGVTGPYLGQMKAVLARKAPHVPVVDLFADAPACDPRAAAYLLAAYAEIFEVDDVLLCVVDPGVGGARVPVIVKADGRWLVGPDNGLFELVIRRAACVETWEIAWRPQSLSASFHGRDLFAPVAALLACGEAPPGPRRPIAPRPDWPDDLAEIVYIDHYGNAMTGLRAGILAEDAMLEVNGLSFRCLRTFGDAAPGEGLWYENANGLAEIAVNQGRADALGLRLGSAVNIVGGTPGTICV